IGVEKLKEITAWAEATGHKLFAGEFGTDTSELSQKALDNMLAYMDEHPVWIGGTYWAGGPWIGSYKFSVEPTTVNGVVTDKPQLGILQRYDLKVTPLPADLVAGVNVGGLVGYTDKDTGVYYRPDGASNPSQFLSGTSKVTDVTAVVAATNDDTIYQSVRTGKNFGYNVAVANGTYSVELQFDETYWSANGKRVFDVLLEGQEVVSNLDVFAVAGKNAAYSLTRTVSVTDGQLNIRFDAGGSDDRDDAMVSGFAVRQLSLAPPSPPTPGTPIPGTPTPGTQNPGTAVPLSPIPPASDPSGIPLAVVHGNAGANRLSGAAGPDLIDGRAGSDRIRGGAGDDTLLGGAGNDRLTGDGGNDRLYGGTGQDRLNGGTGHDLLFGGPGHDQLIGGTGRDAFVFNSRAAGAKDAILDFKPRDDAMLLDNAAFKALGAAGSMDHPVLLKAKAFWKGSAAHDASDRIIYDPHTGILSYDRDGTGAAAPVEIATLAHDLKITAKDFFVI
ncbi:MAG: malectin domain-containing carbohydrate-binding protein, partial [Microvirga sp.]